MTPVALSYSDWLARSTKSSSSLSYSGASPMILSDWVDDYADADDFTRVMIGAVSATNVGNYDSQPFNMLVTRAETAPASVRTQLYIQASRLALNDAAVAVIGDATVNWRCHSNVSGLALWPGVLFGPTAINNDWTKVDVS